jgi:hypothetical protein
VLHAGGRTVLLAMSKAIRGRYGHALAHFAHSLLRMAGLSPPKMADGKLFDMHASTASMAVMRGFIDMAGVSEIKPGDFYDALRAAETQQERRSGDQAGSAGVTAAATTAGNGDRMEEDTEQVQGSGAAVGEDEILEKVPGPGDEITQEQREYFRSVSQCILSLGRDYELEIAALEMLPNGLLPHVSKYASLQQGERGGGVHVCSSAAAKCAACG